MFGEKFSSFGTSCIELGSQMCGKTAKMAIFVPTDTFAPSDSCINLPFFSEHLKNNLFSPHGTYINFLF